MVGGVGVHEVGFQRLSDRVGIGVGVGGSGCGSGSFCSVLCRS